MQDHSGRQKALDKKRAGLTAPAKRADLGSDVDEDMAIEDREEVGHNADAEMNGFEVDQDALEDEAKVRLGGESFFDAKAEKVKPTSTKQATELAGHKRPRDEMEEDEDMDFEAIE